MLRRADSTVARRLGTRGPLPADSCGCIPTRPKVNASITNPGAVYRSSEVVRRRTSCAAIRGPRVQVSNLGSPSSDFGASWSPLLHRQDCELSLIYLRNLPAGRRPRVRAP
jgi:hypothetical protein